MALSRRLMSLLAGQPPWLIATSLTLVLIGYLTIWVPLAPAGLRLTGFEVGEWVKFLPQARSGDLPSRNFFYLPPITLALALIAWTAVWPNSRWQTWFARLLAIACSLLAWPSLEVVRFEASTEWRLRVAWVLLVVIVALVAGWPRGRPVAALVGLVAAGVGLTFPTWAALAYRPAIAFWVRGSVGLGLGVWLNAFGHGLLLLYFGNRVRGITKNKKALPSGNAS